MIEGRETHIDVKGFKFFRTENTLFSNMVLNL